MTSAIGRLLFGLGLLYSAGSATAALILTDPLPAIAIPRPGVPEVVAFEGTFVRSAANEEGYVVVGFQPANRSIGDDWLILDVGTTVLGDLSNFTLSRAAFSLELPDGSTLPLATVSEQRAAYLQKTAKLPRDPVAYFPRSAYQPCNLDFFPSLNSGHWPFDEVELNPDRACLGRLYFHVPGGITLGEHWLNVQFPGGPVRVPFSILTAEEERYLAANLREIRKQVEAAFAPAR